MIDIFFSSCSSIFGCRPLSTFSMLLYLFRGFMLIFVHLLPFPIFYYLKCKFDFVESHAFILILRCLLISVMSSANLKWLRYDSAILTHFCTELFFARNVNNCMLPRTEFCSTNFKKNNFANFNTEKNYMGNVTATSLFD